MANVLKEIGVQQWRLRTNKSSEEGSQLLEDSQPVVSIESLEHEPSSFQQPVENIPNSEINTEPANAFQQNASNIEHRTSGDQQGALEESSPASVNGFSGSLKQALSQSIQAKVGSSNPSSPLNTEQHSNDTSANKEDALPDEAKKIAAVPLNLSGLLGSNEEAHSNESAPVVFEQPVGTEFDGDYMSGSVAPVEPVYEVGWSDLQGRIKTNEHCPSCGWGNSILGSGNQQANWLFVVDAPNVRDIEAKIMFSGRAGQLFEAMLSAIGLEREQVYTTSIFKCAPTNDLSVTPQCDSIVRQQIKLVAPKVIITFGEFAAQAIIKSNLALKDLRPGDHFSTASNTPIIPTYSPAQMLDDGSLKALVWQDLQKSLSAISV